ncbi:MAG: glycoside hydrolase family 127 protein [Anaerolineales bacterium]|nr:glycoside hydrolase family 127 protein [Anaerolineales bacterium]
MNTLSPRQVSIDDAFWTPRLETNARTAIFHQWRMLEESGCIDNFRLAAGEIDGLRQGWFFADSDAYKWLDAAARVHATQPSEKLVRLMNGFIDLLSRAQMVDGYIYTYNQLHFPLQRWENLMIEHELYCHGHLIEAGVSHYEATGIDSGLTIARKAADRLVRDFLESGPARTSGHEEVEIALLRLYETTGHAGYLDLARAFLERRGQAQPFFPWILAENRRVEQRRKIVRKQRRAYLKAHPQHAGFQLPPGNFAKAPKTSHLRWMLNAFTGKYFQMHAPIRRQVVPVGHAVRFGYLETAVAMLHRLTGDRSLLPAMEAAWERMVTRRMYVTGGLGAVPGLEGFGQDDELDPEYAYAETCAALASLFWNWELALATRQARYSDLFEWQLYNAASVGMGLDGDDYLYNNPLACRGGVTRKPWFAVPCCPSNLSRTWASLGKYIYSFDQNDLWIHQYIGSQTMVNGQWKIDMETGLPWVGRVRIEIDPQGRADFTLHLRIPSWAGKFTLQINGESWSPPPPGPTGITREADSGYEPRQAWFLPVSRTWSTGDTLEIDFEMPVTLRRASPRLRQHHAQVALTCGPLVYCLESIDNPGLDLFAARIRAETLQVEADPDLLGGIRVLRGETTDGRIFTAIPYQVWANRGETQMNVWINI